MATQLQLRRGTTVENEGFTGALAEVTVDTDTHELRVHDGSTQGGFVIPTQAGVSSDLSGKADKSTTYTRTETDSLLGNKASTDLDNLTSVGANIANWSTDVTICITEIPQDIKLELNNGTLTLKAGSKVYVPNGSGVFDAYTVPSDLTNTPSAFSTSTNRMYVLSPNKLLTPIDTGATYVYSGTTAPTSFDNGKAWWYDTANNTIKRTGDSGSNWVGGYSLPIALADFTNGVGVSKINQVFNGLGYIGSTVFALPGVKGLAPDGRNADGTLKNILFINNIVQTLNVNSADNKCIGLSASGYLRLYNGYYESETKPSTNWSYWYRPSENLSYNTQTGTPLLAAATPAVRIAVDNNLKITAFTPKTVFHAVDYSDTDFIGHQAMPSSRYVDLTLGATGSSYTAPADGYYTINKAGISGEWIFLYNTTTGLNISNLYPGNLNARLFIPVSKGDSIQVNYTASGTTNMFRFIYANGAK